MNSVTTTYLTVLNGAVCLWFLVRLFLVDQARTVQSDIVQGVLIGFGLSFVVAQIYARIKTTRTNGWLILRGCGEPGKGMLFRAACAQLYPGPVNVEREALYWTTSGDGAGRRLTGKRDYVLRFPPGGLPPNDAFWSLTMGDSKNRFVANPIKRYSVGDRSGLAPNADGSVDIHIRNAAPPGKESNWLPAPPGGFILWLRVYLPGAAILAGDYAPPPIVEARL
jgi:hypothetical protein